MADLSITGIVSTTLDTRSVLFGPYWSDEDTAVVIYLDAGNDLNMARTINAGASWAITEIETGTAVVGSAWYDGETTNDTGTLLHVVWADSGASEIQYVNIDVSDGTVSSIVLIDDSYTISSTPQSNRAAITKTLNGNLLVGHGTTSENHVFRSTDDGATWTSRTAVTEGTTSYDYIMFFPADTGDDADAACIYWDRSTNVLSVKMYDDSANTWTETTIQTGMVDDTFHMNFDAVLRHSDGHIFLAAHSDDDQSTDDIRTYDLTVDSIASPTVTVLPSTGWVIQNIPESAQVALIINQQNDDLYCAYLKGGTWVATVNVYYKISTDNSVSWGSEQSFGENADDDLRLVHGGRSVGDNGGRVQFTFFNDDTTAIFTNINNDIPISGLASDRRVFNVS